MLDAIWVILISAAFLMPALALIIWCIKDTKPDKQDIKILFLFIALSIIFGIIKSYLYVISLFIAYLFYKDKKQMYKWLFIISSISLLVFVVFALVRIMPNVAMLRYDDYNADVITNIRHTFGFNHPNHVLKYVLATCVFGYMALGDNKIHTLIFTIVMLFATLFLGYLTNCRTGILVIITMLTLMNLPFLVNWFKPKRLIFIFILISFVMIAFKDIEVINHELSGRPYWFNLFFEKYPGYILFGKYYLVTLIENFSVDSYVKYPLDNDFLMTIFDGGLVALLTMIYFYYVAFEKANDKKYKWIFIVTPILYTGVVALSRIVVGAHYMSDVVVGGTVGFLSALIGYFIVKAIYKKKMA
jgi:membrane-associated phospholipid phosphatase